jgi:hypothetical protein
MTGIKTFDLPFNFVSFYSKTEAKASLFLPTFFYIPEKLLQSSLLLALTLSVRYFSICPVVSIFLLLILAILMHNAIIKKVPKEPVARDNQ